MTTSDAELAALFLEFSRNKLLNQYWPRLRSSVEPLTDEQVWCGPTPPATASATFFCI